MNRPVYDENNVFAKILREEIPNDTVYEDDHVLAFHNIAPEAPIHIVMICKGAYQNISDFSEKARDEEIVALNRAVAKVADKLGIIETGYRVISNTPGHGGQEVPHMHWHIMAGEPLGPLRVSSSS